MAKLAASPGVPLTVLTVSSIDSARVECSREQRGETRLVQFLVAIALGQVRASSGRRARRDAGTRSQGSPGRTSLARGADGPIGRTQPARGRAESSSRAGRWASGARDSAPRRRRFRFRNEAAARPSRGHVHSDRPAPAPAPFRRDRDRAGASRCRNDSRTRKPGRFPARPSTTRCRRPSPPCGWAPRRRSGPLP